MAPSYISWASSCSRSDHTARELGGRSHMVYAGSLGSHPLTVVAKYLLQAVQTIRILARDKPDVVFVMSPPVVAGLPVRAYCAAARIPYVIDAHTAAFLHPRWQRLQWLQRWLARGAATTIVTNSHLAGIIEAGGAHATLVRDVPIVFGPGTFPRTDAFSVAVICSFNDDEPVAAMWAAAARLPAVQFNVSGDPKHLGAAVRASCPPNLHLTGFLPTGAYGDLVTRADVVMTLTSRDHTMLRGAYEAIYQGTPVIVSDWPVLRQAFPEGAVHVDNSVDAIVHAVQTVQSDPAAFRAGAARLRRGKQEEWRRARARIVDRLGAAAPHASGRVAGEPQ